VVKKSTTMSWVAAAAVSLGASEAALKLILGQLAGVPLMLLYRALIAHRETNVQHLFFFLTGILAGQWVIGGDVVHSLYAVLATYLILLCAGGTLISVIVSFLFNFGYLLVGYVYTETEGYDICWTMPHCVLSLKLIGLTFDCYDGDRASRLGEGILSKDQKKSFLPDNPSLLEMLSHSFFLGGYFVGPQIPLKRYRQFVRPDYTSSLPASPMQYGLKRLGLAFCYMLIQVIGSLYLPASWPASESFQEISFPLRFLLLPIWVKIVLSKYIFAWLLAESVCIFSGLSFVEQRQDGSVDWRGCANVKVHRLETAVCFGNIIEAFNINTNNWVAVYVFKRLKFLGNKVISQVATLIFLAIWHGFHAGYYLTFFNEFVTIMVERQFLSTWGKSAKVAKWKSHPAYSTVTSVLGWLWVWAFLPHAFIPFSLLLWSTSMQAYASTFFFMYIVYASWFLFLRGALKQALPSAPKEKVDKHVEDDNPVHEPVEERKVERIEDTKEDVMITEGVEDTKNKDRPMVSKNDSDEKDVLDQDKVAEADVVQSLMEPKPSVMN